MAFVVSQGRLTGLSRPSPPMVSSVRLSASVAMDYAALYRSQPHVRTVISFLARNIAQIGLHTFERVSDVDRKRLTAGDSPLAALIAKPNPRTTRYRWLEALVSDIGIYDVACHVKLKGDGEVPGGLLRLPPAQIEPVGDSWQWADKVRFRGSKGKIDLDAADVVLIHGYHPTDSRWGLSPMETLRQILAEEWAATQYREQLWRNGARFPGHIERPAEAPKWSDPARERFRQDWRGLYTGDGPGAGGTPVLEDGMKFVGAGITPAQAQYLETRKLTREEVAAAFHIPLPMVGILDHATFSNIEEQHKHLYQDTLGPWLAMIEQELALQLVPEFDTSGRVYVEFNLAEKMKGSFEEQAASLQTAVGAPWLTRNEARARQNLPQIEGGDALVVPLNVLTGGQASPTDAGSQNRNAAPGPRVKARPENHDEKAEQVLADFFARQGRSVLSRIGAGREDWWDGERWDGELSSTIAGLYLLTATEAGRQTLASLGIEPDEYDETRTEAFLLEAARRSAEEINAATREQVQMALDDGSDDAPARVFESAQTVRAIGAAAAVVSFASGFGTTEAARQRSQGATKTWLVTSSNPRASHAAMNGETVPIDEPFSNGLDWPGAFGPADEVAGCMCSVAVNIP